MIKLNNILAERLGKFDSLPIQNTDRIVLSWEKILRFRKPKAIGSEYFVFYEANFDSYKDSQPINDDKPMGLWYGIGKEWINYAKSEGIKQYKQYSEVYKIKVNLSKMILLDNKEKMLNFYHEYKYKPRGWDDKKVDYFKNDLSPDKIKYSWYINWKKVSEKYSGIEINPFQDDCYWLFSWYHSWSVASGCIWSKDAYLGSKKIYSRSK